MRIGDRWGRTLRALAIGVAMLAPAGGLRAEGLYVAGGVGGSFARDWKFEAETNVAPTTRAESRLDPDLGFTAAASVGWAKDLFRVEAELRNTVYDTEAYRFTSGGVEYTAGIDGRLTLSHLMVNGLIEAPLTRIIDEPMLSPVRVYGGGGIGMAVYEPFDDGKTAFTWNAIGGVGYAYNDQWMVTAEYRYTQTGDFSIDKGGVRTDYGDLRSHGVMFGLRYAFDGGLRNGQRAMPRVATAEPMPGAILPGSLAPMEPAGMPPAMPLPSDGAMGMATPSADMEAAAMASIPMATGGHWGVQVGAYRSEAAAMAAWPEAQHRYGVSGLAPRVVVEQVPGKGRMHRLYASGLSKDNAERMCSGMKARGNWCRVAAL